jgi:hypothetical protein
MRNLTVAFVLSAATWIVIVITLDGADWLLRGIGL